jgi:hypothetical protein
VSLKDRLHDELTAAMRSGDSARRDALRLAQHAAYTVEKRNQRPLTEDELVAVLAREVKTRRESVDAFRKGGREDLAAREEAGIAVISEFLPQALSEDEVRQLVTDAIVATGAISARDLGKVMGWLSPKTRGRADGKHVNELVAQALATADLAAHDGLHPDDPAARGGPGG